MPNRHSTVPPAHPTCSPAWAPSRETSMGVWLYILTSYLWPSVSDPTSLSLCTDRNQGLLRELKSYSQPAAQGLVSISCPPGFFLGTLY